MKIGSTHTTGGDPDDYLITLQTTEIPLGNGEVMGFLKQSCFHRRLEE
jgi:hypothetical protein